MIKGIIGVAIVLLVCVRWLSAWILEIVGDFSTLAINHKFKRVYLSYRGFGAYGVEVYRRFEGVAR